MQRYSAIGVMSGSSLDGMDLAWCEFTEENGKWTYSIREARTIPCSATLRDRLVNVMQGSALELARLHCDMGKMIGDACREMVEGKSIDLIASHGHTIFHKPDEGLTTQIGCGAEIAARSGITTICDFRTMDVALGGQGAPLVPLGEKLLFPQYKTFLNIGGICNIAVHSADRVVGYDVCIGNQALNFLAEEIGERYDRDGAMARSGEVNAALLQRLNALPFHAQAPPRSLGREWFGADVQPFISDVSITLKDRMRTVVEHMATIIGRSVKNNPDAVLVTGGGAHNGYLMERISALCDARIEIPDRVTIEYKEALIFALLGVLRLRKEETALASVTGARQDSVGGAMYMGN